MDEAGRGSESEHPIETWGVCALTRDHEPYRWAGHDLTDEQIRALALGVIQSHGWGAYNDTVALDGPSRDNRSEVVDALHDWWGIAGGDELLGTVRQLHTGMHAPAFALINPLVESAVAERGRYNSPTELPARHADFLRVYARFQGEREDAYSSDYQNWLQANQLGLTKYAPTPMPTTAVAWDLCRAAWLVRAGVTTGYLTTEQAWPELRYGLSLARKYFRNWRQLGDSFLAGHAFWSSRDLSDMENATLRRRGVLLRLWQLPDSPWRRVALHAGDPVC